MNGTGWSYSLSLQIRTARTSIIFKSPIMHTQPHRNGAGQIVQGWREQFWEWPLSWKRERMNEKLVAHIKIPPCTQGFASSQPRKTTHTRTKSIEGCCISNVKWQWVPDKRAKIWVKGRNSYLMFYTQSPSKGRGSYQYETKCIPTTSEHSDSLFNTHSTVESWRNLEKMKLNEPWKKLCKQVQFPPATVQVKGVSEPTPTTPLDSLRGG